jgi:hypothetical protein
MVAMGTRAPLGSPGPVPAGPEGLWLEAFLEAPSGFLRPKTGLQGRLAAPASRRFRFSRLLLSANGRLLDVTVVGTPGSLVSAHHSTVSLLPRSPRLAASDAGTNAPSQTRKRHYAPGPRGGDKRGRRVKHRSAATSDIPAPLVAPSARAGLEPAPDLIRGGDPCTSPRALDPTYASISHSIISWHLRVLICNCNSARRSALTVRNTVRPLGLTPIDCDRHRKRAERHSLSLVRRHLVSPAPMDVSGAGRFSEPHGR